MHEKIYNWFYDASILEMIVASIFVITPIMMALVFALSYIFVVILPSYISVTFGIVVWISTVGWLIHRIFGK